ncbi:MAG: autotransporter outer membrane beta-barrel domain-containing protein [Veillonella sp.]|uniref:autotransporter outer membrane beta-barrel domain-containing protein n=1 Tax=Veillonella sp. TaxID=1926307 RepID=UPI0025E5FCAE|nr:autotransporter outer membrane beta-barrel domain-containing protein [Veillonella sp.]MBE6079383.1 autotransporter outer membrane beta-barrel domain-containing protein [Veillonella sp.]
MLGSKKKKILWLSSCISMALLSANMVAYGADTTVYQSKITGDVTKDAEYSDAKVLDGIAEYRLGGNDITIPGIEVGANSAETVVIATDAKLNSGVIKNAAGKTVVINAKTLNLVNESNNSLEGFKVASDDKDKKSEIEIHGHTNLYAKSGGPVIGVFSAGNSKITFDGDFIANGKSRNDELGINGYGGVVYHGATGLYAVGNSNIKRGGQIEVKGNTDITSSGNGATVILNGGSIVSNESSQYYSLIAESASIFANMNEDHTAAGSNTIVVKGNIGALNGAVTYGAEEFKQSIVQLGLSDAQSSFTGVVDTNFDQKQIEQGFTPNVKLFINNDATWNHEAYGKTSEGFKGTQLEVLAGGNTKALAGNILQKDWHDITVESYKGNMRVFYEHDSDNSTNIRGGNLIVKHAETGSVISMITDNQGLNTSSNKATDKNLVSETLNSLAKKLVYRGYIVSERNLTGEVIIAEGLTSSSASLKTGNIMFDSFNGQGSYEYEKAIDEPEQPNKPTEPANPSKPTEPKQPNKPLNPVQPAEPKQPNKPAVPPNPSQPEQPEKPVNPAQPSNPGGNVESGSYETAIMKNTSNAIASSAVLWRTDINNLSKRLGDLQAGTESGIWARIYGGEAEYNKNSLSVTNKYKAVQVGADKKLENGWHVGGAVGYNRGEGDYANGSSGKSKLLTAAAYATTVKADGQYIDVIAKVGNLRNSFTSYNSESGALRNYVSGKYSTNVLGLGVEYGKKIQRGSAIITPQVELTWARLGADSFAATSPTGESMQVNQSAITSLIGRMGAAGEWRQAKSSYYVKGSLLHEFKGDSTTHFQESGKDGKSTDFDFKDTWFEVSVGGAYDFNPSSSLYFDVAKSFGGDYELNWEINAGMRFKF